MKFKGDIIITDPCYIIKENPIQYPDFRKYMSEETYKKKPADFDEKEKEQSKAFSEATEAYWKESRANDDWDKCSYGDNMEALGIRTYLTRSTEYGDWSCTTFRNDKQAQELLQKMNAHYMDFFNRYNFSGASEEEKKAMYEDYQHQREDFDTNPLVLGHFCADAGLVSVFLLEEVLAYNPNFDYHLNRPHTTTLIKDFDGDIEITHRTVKVPKYDENYNEIPGEFVEEREVSVIGTGNIPFYTSQTGL